MQSRAPAYAEERNSKAEPKPNDARDHFLEGEAQEVPTRACNATHEPITFLATAGTRSACMHPWLGFQQSTYPPRAAECKCLAENILLTKLTER